MKKFAFLLLWFLVCFSLNAKSSKIPEWVNNHKKVFPNAEYIAQRGVGKSAEKARTDAASSLARYFQTNVSANLSTSLSSVTTSNFIEEKTVVIDDVKVLSEVEFFGLEYTEPFYVKSEKKWYCIAYLNREDVWTQYKPQVDIKKNTFNALYSKLEAEKDYFTKIEMCKKVFEAGGELLEKLEYARLISAQNESFYQDERDKISNLPVILEESKQNCSIYIAINQDFNKSISSSLSTIFSEYGLNISKNGEKSNYIAEVFIEENLSGSEPISIKPSVNLKIVNKNGKSVFSVEILSSEKSLGYALESAQKKLTQNL